MADNSSEPGSSELPHGKTKLLHKYTPFDYGPLARLPDAATVIGSFRGGSYYLTVVEAEEGLVLYRLCDDRLAEAFGRYWTLENREGVLGDRIDLAVPLKWNDFTKSSSLIVPKGVFLFEGPVSPQLAGGGPVGGGWQVFIPREVLKPLCVATDLTLSQEREASSCTENQAKVKQCIEEAILNQRTYFESYEKEMKQMNQKIIEDFCNSREAHTFLTSGNNLPNLDAQVLCMLQESECAGYEATSVPMEEILGSTTNLLLHSEEVRLADGSMRCVSLYVQLEFSQQTAQPKMTFGWK